MSSQPNPDPNVLIVGAGPAGLQLASDLQQAGVAYEVIEALEAGATFQTLPRHRQLISINKVNTGGTAGEERLRYDWNSLLSDGRATFPAYSDEYFPSADDYATYLADFAREGALNIRTGVRVENISRSGGTYSLECSDGRARSATKVVIATGLNRRHVPDIRGVEHAEQYATFDTDPRTFRDQRVLIIGKGNSAFETAESLIPYASTIHVCSPTPLRFAWQSHYLGHLRAVNNNFLDTYQLKSQNAALDAHVERIERREDGLYVTLRYSHAAGHETTIRYDRVICCTGFRFNPSVFDDSAAPETCHDDRFPSLTSSFESVNRPGLYFAGALMHGLDYQKHTSGFIHGFRYNVRFLARLFTGHLKEEQRLAARHDSASLARAVVDRLNNASAIFLQPGYFADAAVADGDSWLYHQDVPLGYLRDHAAGRRWISVTLEFGPHSGDPFNIQREQTEAYAEITPFLHPVLRCHEGDEVVDTLHLIEDVENTFSGPLIEEPLEVFLRKHTAVRGPAVTSVELVPPTEVFAGPR
ncbi:MAG: NAD(P)-binding domain-containing protein [Actinomycetota bacterium]|nr:NAD(P)-binding domain-containing protein [Actinomycetota bacterium]